MGWSATGRFNSQSFIEHVGLCPRIKFHAKKLTNTKTAHTDLFLDLSKNTCDCDLIVLCTCIHWTSLPMFCGIPKSWSEGTYCLML